jgi:hypothetical protein
LARRTRRDLSNKRIRKIVKKKHQNRDYSADQPRSSSSALSKTSKPVIYLIFIAFVIFLIYYFIDSQDLTGFLTDRSPHETALAAQDTVEQIQSKAEQENQPIEPVPQKTQIEVLNGCGISGLAKNTMEFLRKSDLDVVYMGNYKNFTVQKSQVMDRIGNKDIALKIASILGIGEEQVETEIDESKQVAASVIIGKDYQKLKPFKK